MMEMETDMMKTNKKQILIEGRIQDLWSKYVSDEDGTLVPRDKISKRHFQNLVRHDPSGNQKYLEWMVKAMINGWGLLLGPII